MFAVVRSSSLVMTPSNSLKKRPKVSTDRLEREPKETYDSTPLFARHVCHDPWLLAVCFSSSGRRSVRSSARPSFLDRSIPKSGSRRDHLLRLVRRDRRTRESASGQESQRPEFARYSESSWTEPPSSTFSVRWMAQRRAELDVSFQEVVHPVNEEAEVVEALANPRRTEWTPIRMRL
jgi:hypothetical protein